MSSPAFTCTALDESTWPAFAVPGIKSRVAYVEPGVPDRD